MIEAKETLTGNILSKQTISGALNKATEKLLPELESLTIIPTKEQQIYNHENSDGYDKVTVNPIPAEYIIPDGTLPITENTTYDVRNYARVSASVHPAPNLQDKQITPTKETQKITSDEGYDGLNQVTVNPIPDNYVVPSGSLEINENGTYDVKEYAEATINVAGSGGGSGAPQPYVLQYGVIQEGTGTSYNETIANALNTGVTSDIVNMALVFGFVRSNYTLSDNITLLTEKKSIDNTGLEQTLFVGYCPYSWGTSTKLTVTQETSGRIAIGYILLSNCGTPFVVDDVTGTDKTGINISTDGNLNIYLLSQVYGATLTPKKFNEYRKNQRLAYFISNYASDDKKIVINDNSYNAIAHIQLPFEEVI